MQPIERYGVVALLFLVATFTAVLVMGESSPLGEEQAVMAKGQGTQSKNQSKAQGKSKPGARRSKQQEAKRLRMSAEIQSAPLSRDSFPEQRARQEEAAQAAKERLMQERALRKEQERERLRLQSASEAPVLLATSEMGGSRGGFARAGDQLPARGNTSSARRSEATNRLAGEPGPRPRASGLREYKVKRGDTLGEIALEELGTSRVWKLICEVNPGLTPAKLIVGRTILLPSASTVALAVERRASAKRSNSKQPVEKPASKKRESVALGNTVPYTVAEGESLWRIAQRQLGNGSRFTEIVQLNPDINPDSLRVGQRLNLPADAKLDRSASSNGGAPTRSAPIAQQKTTKKTGRVR